MNNIASPINEDSLFHAIMEELLLASLKQEDSVPRRDELIEFFRKHGQQEAPRSLFVEPTDVGLTLGELAEFVSPTHAKDFVDGMFMDFSDLSPEVRSSMSNAAKIVEDNAKIEDVIKVIVGSMRFSWGDLDALDRACEDGTITMKKPRSHGP